VYVRRTAQWLVGISGVGVCVRRTAQWLVSQELVRVKKNCSVVGISGVGVCVCVCVCEKNCSVVGISVTFPSVDVMFVAGASSEAEKHCSESIQQATDI